MTENDLQMSLSIMSQHKMRKILIIYVINTLRE